MVWIRRVEVRILKLVLRPQRLEVRIPKLLVRIGKLNVRIQPLVVRKRALEVRIRQLVVRICAAEVRIRKLVFGIPPLHLRILRFGLASGVTGSMPRMGSQPPDCGLEPAVSAALCAKQCAEKSQPKPEIGS